MRSRLLSGAVALALALGALAWLPTHGDAEPVVAATSPLQTIGERSGDGSAVPAPASDAEPIIGMSLEETRDRVAETEVLLRVTRLQKETDDRNLAGMRAAVAELREETADIAQSTVQGAIANYRQSDLDESLLEISDLNEGLRATTLGNAAIVADTETFDEYRDSAKDLQLAERDLDAEVAENDALAARVATLQAQLESEMSWLADFEERNLQRQARSHSLTESGWAQAHGRKQGFYLRTCPVAGAHNFIDSWGFPRSGGRRHRGVDILAEIGVPIVAPVAGRVEFRSNSVGGRSFHLWDEHGNYFYGTHMSAYGDVTGEVAAGQVIGYVGDDGNAAGIPHLHFEIHAGGRGNQINPFIDAATVCDGSIGG